MIMLRKGTSSCTRVPTHTYIHTTAFFVCISSEITRIAAAGRMLSTSEWCSKQKVGSAMLDLKFWCEVYFLLNYGRFLRLSCYNLSKHFTLEQNLQKLTGMTSLALPTLTSIPSHHVALLLFLFHHSS